MSGEGQKAAARYAVAISKMRFSIPLISTLDFMVLSFGTRGTSAGLAMHVCLLSTSLMQLSTCSSSLAQDPRAVIARVRESRERLVTYDVRMTWSDAEGVETAVQRGDFLAQSHRIEFNTNGSSSVIFHSDRLIYMAGRESGQTDVVVAAREPHLIPYSRPIDIRAVGLTNFLSNNDVECLSKIISAELDGDQLAVIAGDDENIVQIASEVSFRGANAAVPGVRVYAIDALRGYSVVGVDVYMGAPIADVVRMIEGGETKLNRIASVRTEWKQLGTDWVPSRSQVLEAPDAGDSKGSPRAISVQFDWNSVNETLDPELFEYSALASPGAKVHDMRVDPPVLIEQVPLELPVAQRLGSARGSEVLRWLLFSTGAILAGVAVLAIFRSWRGRPSL